MNRDCPFDNPDPERVFYENDLAICLWDGFPVSEGHALVITRRHVASWFDTTEDERRALLDAIEVARREIVARRPPDGFNIGINIDEAAGQTVPHVHVHVIPRYEGDVEDPRGGVRYVIPDKANYLVTDAAEAMYAPVTDATLNLSTGPNNPLLPMLLADLDRAVSADVAVAFTLTSGISLLLPHFQDLLARPNARLRFLTGDYLNVTHQGALRSLLDLHGNREIRVFETGQSVSFHPKAYIFHFADGHGRAYVGSSNISRMALVEGVEWNYRVVSSAAKSDFQAICDEFETLYRSENSVVIDDDWIDAYEHRRPEDGIVLPEPVPPEPPPGAPSPHSIQQEALDALRQSRAAGNTAGLVVLATGLGKTWLSAFDTMAAGAKRVLFVAHRDEILNQAIATFRKIRPDGRLGRFTGKEKDWDADILFASIQTLGRLPRLRSFARDAFDYIIVDEFHHAAARTYKNLINYFDCRFLLGLTATPERTDGGDLLSLCGENLVYRCDLFEGINLGLLSPFHYYGVPDDVDYSNIPWRSSRFDPEELEAAVATQARAENAHQQWLQRAGQRTLAFCCSKRHATFTADYFRSKGVNARAVHSGPDAAPRASSLEALQRGEIEVLCAVDMFNEGVDVPNIDTVLMLRPTESAILWTQQVGRGLRRAEDKSHLTVIDYIGNHRIFLTKPRSLLGIGASDKDLRWALAQIRNQALDLPAGCDVTYDLEAMQILESLLRPPSRGSEVVEAYYADFKDRVGARPSALEAFQDGYNPKQTSRKRWLEFMRDMGDLDADARAAYDRHQDFLDALQVTPMTKSFKMLVLLAALNEDAFPGKISIADLMKSVRRIAGRAKGLRDEFGGALENDEALRSLLEKNPINAWTGGAGTGGPAYFRYENGEFSTAFECAESDRPALQDLTRELAEWRLADYQSRQRRDAAEHEFVCKVIHANNQPILKLPDRSKHPTLPQDWTEVHTAEGMVEAKFVKIAINVMREPDGSTSILPQLMRKWFGPDAGLPGTNFRVAFSFDENGYRMTPQNAAARAEGGLLWKAYAREQIPGLFGFEFSTGSWNQGFVSKPGHLFLLVTLDKGDMPAGHEYQDHFESPDTFAWQSQRRTTQSSRHGILISTHQAAGVTVHLFVRKTKKIGNRTAPFTYCGEVDFVSREGEQPISVTWRLRAKVPQRLYEALS